jgi:cytochrome bd-type quinol oxidase subunit 2
MSSLTENAKRDRTFWRGMYLISFVIGTVLPVASIIAAGAMTDDGLSPQPDQAALLALYIVWSAATLVSVLGTTSAAWIVISTGEKLGIDRSRGYLQGMFLQAFTTGGVVPIAAIIAVGVMSRSMARVDPLLLIVAWGGMLAVCIAGLCPAVWLVKTAALKLTSEERRSGSLETEYHSPRAHSAADAR